MWAFFQIEFLVFKTFVSLKLKIFLGTAFSLWGSFIAVETFKQQLILALIAAAPPTAAVIVTCIVLMKGQQKMATAMDGKLSQLLTAEKGVSRAEGVAEERAEARIIKKEEATAAAAVTSVMPGSSASNPVHTEITNTPENPANVKPTKGDTL